MRDAILLVGAGLALYTVATMALHARGLFPPWVSVSGPLIVLETDRYPAALEGIATDRRRFWRGATTVGVAVTIPLLVGSAVMVVVAGVLAVTRDPVSAVNQPRNVLAVPGVNDFLPLAATPQIVLGLFVGLFVHEFGHAVLGRVEGIEIDRLGLIFLAIVPFGAFVDMDGREREASVAGRNRIYAAGITNNLAVAAGCFVALALLVSTSIAPVPGLAVGGVVPGTPAADAEIERGDVLTAVDGEPVRDEDDWAAAIAGANGSVAVERADGGPVTVEPAVVVTGAPERGPNTLDPGSRIVAADGERVRTTAAFRDELAGGEPVVTVGVEVDGGSGAGETAGATNETSPVTDETVVAGAYASSVVPDGPLASAGVPADGPVVVTRFDGERLLDHEGLFDALDDASPGETVPVEVYAGGSPDEGGEGARDGTGDERTDGQLRTYDVTLGASSDGDRAHLGVVPAAGVGGLTVVDTGVEPYPAEEHLATLGGRSSATITGTAADGVLAVTFLPFAGALELSTANFGGFVGSVADLYTATGPLSVAGPAGLVLATALFWTGWLNLLLGVFNCIPAYPLDGGKLLETNVRALAERTAPARAGTIATVLTGAVTAVLAIAVLVMLVAPLL